MHIKHLLAGAVLGMSVITPVFAQGESVPAIKMQAPPFGVGSKAPALSIERWVKGDEVKSFKKGEVYVVEFWATWCGPCIAGMPHLSDLQKEYKDKGVTVIGVSIDRDTSAVDPFMNDKGGDDKMKYTVAVQKDSDMYDNWMKPAKLNSIPSSFIVNHEGNIAWIGHPSRMDKPLADAVKAKDQAKATPAGSLKVGDKAPALSIERWVKGDEIKSFKSGDIYVVEFWATWCGPCIAGMPHLSELQKEYKDKGVTIMGVSLDRNKDAVDPFMNDKGGNDKMQYTVAVQKDSDMSNTWMRPANQNGIPTAFLVGHDGKIAWIGHPSKLDAELEKAVHAKNEASKAS